jgi:hypothetical protein
MLRTLLAAVTLVAGCASFNADSFRRTHLARAAFELNCKPEALTVTDLAEREVGVAGCGRRTVYVIAPTGGWVNNSCVQQDGQTAPAAAK